MPNTVICPRCAKPRRKLWLPPRFRRGFADWRITGSGNPLLSDGGDINISTGDDCCCCETCCEEGTAPPQIELDASSLAGSMDTFNGCTTACAAFADVFLLDFRNLRSTDDPEGLSAGICLWRYCDEFDCDGTTVAYGWDVGIFSTGLVCRAVAIPWIGGNCDDFEMTGRGSTTAFYQIDLATDPDDCCDALSSPLTLDPNPAIGSGSGQIVNIDFAGGCNIFNLPTTNITIQEVGC